MARHENRRGIYAASPPVICDGGGHKVDKLRPAVDKVLADDDLAPPRTVDLDSGITRVTLHSTDIAEDQSAAACLQYSAASLMIGRIEAECLCRTAGGDERLNDPKWRPWLFAARLQNNRDLQWDCRHPERVDTG